MKSETCHELLAVCQDIETLLQSANPVADPARLQRLKFLCGKLTGQDAYVSTKASRLESRAQIYFSSRRHANERGGAEAVMNEMRYSLLESIREQLERLQREAGQ